MVKRIGSRRRKTRHKLRKKKSDRGKLGISSFIKELKQGDKVVLKAEPSYHKGMYFHRFHGKTAVVKAKKGSCYEVSVRDGGKQKTLIVHPVHLKRVK
jgi:large subunit ribosomal protein L21e